MAQTNTDNLPQVLAVLDLLTEEELAHLNHVVVERLRLMQQIRQHGKIIQFRIGQSVWFADATGRTVRGIVSRHNRKSVTVVTPDGHQWRVSPQLLETAG
jgi:hypothetical protein